MLPPTPATPAISDVNQLLKKLLLKELPIKKNGIEISFEQPNRNWSSRLNGPTLNLFLYDLHKNKLRQAQWETYHNGKDKVTQQRSPLKVDLHYLVTGWVIDGNPDEEHYLLTAALVALSRHPRLPDPTPSPGGKDVMPPNSRISLDFLPEGLQSQPGPIVLMAAEPDELVNPLDIWSALDNELRPSIICTVTIVFDLFQPIDLSLVRGREFRFGPMGGPDATGQSPTMDSWPHTGREMYQLEGVVWSERPLEDVRVILLERGLHGHGLYVPAVSTNAQQYEFMIPQLALGQYRLEISAKDHVPTPYDFVISTAETENKEEKGGILLTTKVVKEREGEG